MLLSKPFRMGVDVVFGLSGAGFTIEDPASCGAILDQALANPGPVVVKALVDPFVPRAAGEDQFKQSEQFAESLARGEPDRAKIAWTVLSDKVRELI
jgi:pyruvate dehydrogenase (quinone)